MEHGWGVRLRAGAVIGVGLLLALAATAGPLPLPGGEPGGSLTLRLPRAVQMVVVVLLALSALLLLALQRPRRPAEDEPLFTGVPQRRSVWSALLALLPLLVLVVAFWYLIWHRSGEEGHPIETAITAIAGLLDLLASARKTPTSVPFFDFTIAALVLLFALATFALMVLVALSGPLEKWWTRRAGAAGATPGSAGSDDRPDDLRAEADARAAIIRAYGHFEHALADAHAPRAPWQTPAEFMRTTVDRLAVPAGAVRQLTALFEVARFSDRPVGAEARDTACDCLDAITAALDAPEVPPSAR